MYIIAGSNGAGKTTLSYTILPEIFECEEFINADEIAKRIPHTQKFRGEWCMKECEEFINADEIAKRISPLRPDKAGIRAGKLMLQRIKVHKYCTQVGSG